MQLLVRDLPCSPMYQESFVRSPQSSDRLQSPSTDKTSFGRSTAAYSNKDTTYSPYTTKKVSSPLRPSHRTSSETEERGHQLSSIPPPLVVTHRCASSLVPQNSGLLTSKPKASSVTSASQGYVVGSRQPDTDCSKSLLGKRPLTQNDKSASSDTMAREEHMRKQIRKDDVPVPVLREVQGSTRKHCSKKMNAASVSKTVVTVKGFGSTSEVSSCEAERVCAASHDANVTHMTTSAAIMTDLRKPSAMEQGESEASTMSASNVSEIPTSENFSPGRIQQETSLSEARETSPFLCTSASQDAAVVLGASEVPGIQLSPCSAPMVFTSINGMLLSLPATPTIQVIVVNNYPVSSGANTAGHSPTHASRPEGSRLCAIAPAPAVAVGSGGNVQTEKDQKGRSTLSNHHRMYKCDHANCNKTYFKNSHLKVHQRIHTGRQRILSTFCHFV